jgi:SAM-dependent methyltransferase
LSRGVTGYATEAKSIDFSEEFKRRGPWVTKFVIDGKDYGGSYDARADNRINQFFEAFPNARTILELGSLEGGHSFALASRPSVRRVVAIEGRPTNVAKARFVQRILNFPDVEFITANLEHYNLSLLGDFDVVFCVGVLYHLPRPWELLGGICKVSRNLFLWTHYAPEDKVNEKFGTLVGMRHGEGGLTDPLSGLSAFSFWPTLNSLLRMIDENGFKNVRIIENTLNHPNGPCVTLTASSR